MEDSMARLKLSRKSQPFLTHAVPSSRMYGKKFHGNHNKAITYIRVQAANWKAEKGSNFQLMQDHVKIIVDGAFFSLNMKVCNEDTLQFVAYFDLIYVQYVSKKHT